jgi:purine nucleosidase
VTRPLVVDTDGGTDDCAALWWLLGQSSVEVVGVVATWGNVAQDVAAANVARVLVAAGQADVPILLGADGPIGPGPLRPRGRDVHGEDGLGGHADRWPIDPAGIHPTPAAEWLLAEALRQGGELELLTLGPLSSLAAALAADPDLAELLRSLTVMGGSVRVGGNVLPNAETNIALDPAAAAAVVAAGWIEPPLLVGLDVTLRSLIPVADIRACATSEAPAAQFLVDPLLEYVSAYERHGHTVDGGIPCHDLTAAVAAVHPEVLGAAPTVPLAVDTGGSASWGATVADLRGTLGDMASGFHPWRVALFIDPDAARHAFRSLAELSEPTPT